MTQIGIMIEGQDGLNWERWKKLLQTAEDFGYQCVFRSDHYTNPSGPYKDALELWVSLTYAATATRRIELGSLVAPTTFRHPTMTVRMAAQIDDLSGGRLVLGLGAGWQEREHHNFGIPFYDVPTRHAMLEDALEVTSRLLFSDAPVNYGGKYFQLDDAILLPRPKRPGGPPILIGGNGPKRTLPLAAKYADEWNGVYLPPETYKERSALLDDLLKRDGREPNDVKRSLMTGIFFGKDDATFKAVLDKRSQQAGQHVDLDALRARGVIAGTPSAVVDQIGKLVESGVERFMLQWLDLDDIAGLEAMASSVLPQFHR